MRFVSGSRVGLLLVTLAALLGLIGSAAVAATPADDGKVLFEKDCSSCHSIGKGVLVGPDLKDVTSKSSADWVQAFITDPGKVIASGDARAKDLVAQFKGFEMPKLGLSAEQAAAIVAYLESQSGSAVTTKTPAAAPAAKGDAGAGKNDFTGANQLDNGGPPCLSCHTIAGIGALGGGTMGPDLTGAYKKYGGSTGIASVLTALPFKTMKPIFDGHPLTSTEQANLAAFLQAASSEQRPSDSVWKLVLLGLAVAVGCLALAFAIWPRRRLVVRKNLVPPSTPIRRA
jgi:mono/diheme cytochrome c family protein